ncbi:MAG: lamin tail domain-containing protein, partial [Planctomycetota bacterium]
MLARILAFVRRPFVSTTHAIPLLGAATLALAASAQAGDVRISQVYGGGGNTGAQFKNDFIELYNSSNSPVVISGWAVQYASAAGSTWQTTAIPAATTISAHGYYLVAEGAGAGNGASLPTPNVSGGIAMSATTGKVALTNTSTALAGVCPIGGTVEDFVGFGPTANCFEGAGPTTILSNSAAAIRAGNGCTDSGNNNSDFAVAAPAPRNSASPANIPPTWFQDADADLFGNSSVTLQACSQPLGYVMIGGDCNDANPLINPGAPEVCGNVIDDDCDGFVDEGFATPNDVYVDDGFTGMLGGTDPAGPGQAIGCDSFATIQQAINAVAPGGTVHVASGLYEEQLVITTSGITIDGDGSGNSGADTIVRSPVALSYSFTTGASNFPVIGVHDCSGVTIRDLRVDGFGRGSGNYRFVGVAWFNAGGTGSNLRVVGIRETTVTGSQHGVGYYANNNTGGPYTLTLNDCDASDYQKGGMALSGVGLTFLLDGCDLTGQGPINTIAQNGFQLGLGAGGIVQNSSAANHVYSPGPDTSCGILALQTAALINTANCILSDNSSGVYYYVASGSITNSTISTVNGLYDAIDLLNDASNAFLVTPPRRPV